MSLALITALALAQTTPAQAAPLPPRTADEIIVRAERTEQALAECLARACPTNDDARLSIAHAESQFAEGKYRDARNTLDRAIDRNRGAAARFPRHVAALYEAYSTVSLHYGDREDFKRATSQRAQVLRANLPEADRAVLLLPIEIGDSWLKRGDPREAERQYGFAERGYDAQGEHRLAALAGLRRASIRIASGDAGSAERMMKRIESGPAAADPAVRSLMAVLRARAGIVRGDDAAVDRLLATLRTDAAAPPLLLDEADGPRALARAGRQSGLFPDLTARMQMPGGGEPIQWADIGFMVTPDGRVGDVEVLRGNRMREWTKPIVERVGSRRYAPLALPAGSPGMYRVERYTWRALRMTATGSIVKGPTGPRQLEVLDLTRAEATPAA